MKKLTTFLALSLSTLALTSCSITNSDNSKDEPSSGDTTTPGGGTETPGSGETTTPGGGTETPGSGETTNPGGGTETPGSGETTNPGGGTETPGSGGTTNPGEGTETPGSGGTTNPGEGNETPGDEETEVPGTGVLAAVCNVYDERALITFDETDISKATIKVKKSLNGTWESVANELIKAKSSTEAEVNILGLSSHYKYDIQVVNSKNELKLFNDVEVNAQDRSGYAHFGRTEGIGAYNNDGTLKDNAIVVYVNNENKNTVQVNVDGNTYTGLADILKNATLNNSKHSLDIRILDEIQTKQWNKLDHGTGKTTTRQANIDNAFKDVDWVQTSSNEGTPSSNFYKINEADIISYGINTLSDSSEKIDGTGNKISIKNITKLNGLTNNVIKDKAATSSSKDQEGASHFEYDSYFNELDVKACKNITIEGVGENAGIFQWGFCFNQCQSIEVKNLEFSGYTEDAIGIQGANNGNNDFSGFWLHNNTFNQGVNNWDLTCEHDKSDGDGSTDFKYAHNITMSYNRYNNCHKTALIGPGTGALQYNVTFHHNFYNKCGSRLPFTRQSNIHAYNNYYYGSTGTNMQIDDHAYLFVENSVFENTNNTFTSKDSGSIKSYNNSFLGSASSEKGTVVSDRTLAITSSCKADGVTDMSTFDTNENLFYYDSVHQCSSVMVMHKTEDVKEIVMAYAGSGLNKTLGLTKDSIYTGDGKVSSIKEAQTVNSIPTVAGIYSKIATIITAEESLASSSSANVKYDDSKIYINDTDSTNTTFGFYIFDENQIFTTGEHTYSLDIKLTGIGSKWNMVHFLDGNTNISVRALNSTKNMGYTLDNGTTEVTVKATAFKAGTYSIKLTVNYDTNVVKLMIDGTEVVIDGYTAKTIKGIMFQTANSAADRSFEVSNISIS